MPSSLSPAERREKLGARIAAAKKRLEARQGLEGVSLGSLMSSLNDDLDQIAHEDHDDAHREMDKLEARLRAEQIKAEDDLEDEEEG